MVLGTSIVALTTGAALLFIADALIIMSDNPRESWMKVTAKIQAVSLALGVAAATVLQNPELIKWGFVGVALSSLAFIVELIRHRRRLSKISST